MASSRNADLQPEVAVRVSNVTKRYRLYRKPAYRLLDVFGLCPAHANYYSEHLALQDVDLSIARGEKVAIIGRNGAGKSTLLKVITGLVRPTEGAVVVHGQVSNLLQIGSGFHPDFTGRQNVFASLAHQGLAGDAAASLFDDILAFAEIEEYIDQPMKTYSTGMCSRLMFASSVVIKPDILILDEILGVGDAYFSHKSFERMRELCSSGGTTLLLVTHDVYAAMNLCERFIWIDRGIVKADGEARTVVAMYESSIKEQEEQALRQKLAVAIVERSSDDAKRLLHVIVRSRTGFALQKPLAIDTIALEGAHGSVFRLDAAKPSLGWSHVPDGNLGPEQIVDGRQCRVLDTHGSIYHKVEWIATVSDDFDLGAARICWHYGGTDAAEIVVFSDVRHVVLRGDLTAGRGWQERSFDRIEGPPEPLRTVAQSQYGTGQQRILDVRMLDASGEDVTRVRHGDPLTLRLHVAVNDAGLRQATFSCGFTRLNTPYAVNIINHHLDIPEDVDEYVLDVRLASVKLGSGTWYVRVGLGEAGLFERTAIKYFAVDPAWHHHLRQGIKLEVQSTSHLHASGCFMVHPATFEVVQFEQSMVTTGQAAGAANESAR